jgi:multicomponent Na+:H+ antiporter subunit G
MAGGGAAEWARAIASVGFVSVGVSFFVAGSVGLLRFPDLFTRLHAVTKADNVGLGLVATGLAFEADSIRSILALAGTWLLVVASSSVVGHLIARRAYRQTHAAGPAEEDGG